MKHKDDLFRLARRLEADPCNRKGADKSWVLEVLQNAKRLASAARLLPPGKSGASLH